MTNLSEPTLYFFCATLALVSILYSCVGQAGASGYIAAMALYGFAPAAIKPTALVLNVLVSVVVSVRFCRAGHFSWHLLLPFAISSVPAALLGGYITLPPIVFNRLLGAIASRGSRTVLFPSRFRSALGLAATVAGRIARGCVCRLSFRAYRCRWRRSYHASFALSSLGSPQACCRHLRSVHPHQLSGGTSRSSGRDSQPSSRLAALCARRSFRRRYRLAVGQRPPFCVSHLSHSRRYPIHRRL